LFLFFSLANFLAFLIPPIPANMAVIFSVSICLEFMPSYFASFFLTLSVLAKNSPIHDQKADKMGILIF